MRVETSRARLRAAAVAARIEPPVRHRRNPSSPVLSWWCPPRDRRVSLAVLSALVANTVSVAFLALAVTAALVVSTVASLLL